MSVEAFTAALRFQESGSYEGDYTARGVWNPYQRDESIGAYGIMSKNWQAYASAAGLPRANWRDPRAQDAVAVGKTQEHAREFENNWALVATAWYAGAGVARAVVERHGTGATVEQIRKVAGDAVAEYADALTSKTYEASESEWGQERGLTSVPEPAELMPPTARADQPQQTPRRQAASDMVRGRLMQMAPQDRMSVEDAMAMDEEVSEDGLVMDGESGTDTG